MKRQSFVSAVTAIHEVYPLSIQTQLILKAFDMSLKYSFKSLSKCVLKSKAF